MTAKCPCQHCSGSIAFESSDFVPGMVVTCPHCHMETILFIPKSNPKLAAWVQRIKNRKPFNPSVKFQFGCAVIGVGLLCAAMDYTKHHTPIQSLCAGMFQSMLLCGLTGTAAALYFMPSLIARNRKKRNQTAIFALNLCLGWTFVGWVMALVWSLMVEEQGKTI